MGVIKMSTQTQKAKAREFNEFALKNKYLVEIQIMEYDFNEDKPQTYGISWKSIGTAEQLTTKAFIQQLEIAIEVVNEINKEVI